MQRNMPVGAAIDLLRKEIAEKQSVLAALEAMVTAGTESTAHALPTNGAPKPGARRGKKLSVARAGLEILKTAGRPMHGLREIVPALEAQGYKIKHRAGFATVLLRTNQVERTAPGTFKLKGGAATGT
jgi:hypothetical protein